MILRRLRFMLLLCLIIFLEWLADASATPDAHYFFAARYALPRFHALLR